MTEKEWEAAYAAYKSRVAELEHALDNTTRRAYAAEGAQDLALADRDRLEKAAARLLALKDGPRDEDYERCKPLAWEHLRAALGETPCPDCGPLPPTNIEARMAQAKELAEDATSWAGIQRSPVQRRLQEIARLLGDEGSAEPVCEHCGRAPGSKICPFADRSAMACSNYLETE